MLMTCYSGLRMRHVLKEWQTLLCHSNIDLLQENDAANFLHVRNKHNESGLLEIKQEGLIGHVIEALRLDVGTNNGKATPADAKPLVKDTDGEVAHGDFSYSSVVSMMLYLSHCSRLDIAYAVNCAACYMFCPRYSHELKISKSYMFKKTYSQSIM